MPNILSATDCIQDNNPIDLTLPKATTEAAAVHKKRKQYCAKCQNHGMWVQVKGHKRRGCPKKFCGCELCKLTVKKRKVMSKTIAFRRQQKEDRDCGNYNPPQKITCNSSTGTPIRNDNFDNGIINSPKEHDNQITPSAFWTCFKQKIIDQIDEKFRLNLPNDWMVSLYESLREFLFTKMKDPFSSEDIKILRYAFSQMLEKELKELRSKSIEVAEKYRPWLESHHYHSALQKVVEYNNYQPQYPQSLIAQKNSVNSTDDTKLKSLQSMHMFTNTDNRHHHSDLPLMPMFQKCFINGNIHSPQYINPDYPPFVSNNPITGNNINSIGYQLQSQLISSTTLPKKAIISHTIDTMIKK